MKPLQRSTKDPGRLLYTLGPMLVAFTLRRVLAQRMGLVQQPFQDVATVLQQGFTQPAFQNGHIPRTVLLELLLHLVDEGFGLGQKLRENYLGFFLLSSVADCRVIAMVTWACSLANSSNSMARKVPAQYLRGEGAPPPFSPILVQSWRWAPPYSSHKHKGSFADFFGPWRFRHISDGLLKCVYAR